MEKLKQLATGLNHRFPEGDDAFQITTRLLEECGEVAKEVNRLEKSGTKVLRHGNGTKEDLASEIKDAMNALMQLAIHYDAVVQVQARHRIEWTTSIYLVTTVKCRCLWVFMCKMASTVQARILPLVAQFLLPPT